ncbi:MAG: DUF2339 domain-containing protein [Leptospiraceae bacterium]|nr:DUF2339 domain-containing protein [Leptospiraceae bacterium]MCP5499127.1 DUF2339 domain-containing protein [Leptospiraceae bacterium]
MQAKSKLEDFQKRILKLESELSQLKKDFSLLEENVFIDFDSQASDTKPKRSWIPSILKEDFEMVLAGNLLGKFGLITILFAFLWFIKFAFDHEWINESGRIYIGLILGLLTCISGIFLLKKQLKALPSAIFGTGLSIFYLSITSAYHFYSLIEVEETFAYLVVLSFGTALLSRYTSNQILYFFSYMGSVLSPILLSSGENSYEFLFTYLGIVNLIYLYVLKPFDWRFVPYIALLSNSVIFFSWASENLTESTFNLPFLYLLLSFGVFGFRETYYFPYASRKIYKSSLLLVILLIINYALSFYRLFEFFHPDLNPHFFLLFAASLLAFRHFYEKRNKPVLVAESFPALEAVLLFFFMALGISSITDFAEGKWLTFAYLAFSASVSYLALNFQDKALFRFSILPWLVSLIRLYEYTNYKYNYIFLLNPSFALYLFAGLLSAYIYYRGRDLTLSRTQKLFAFSALFHPVIGTMVDVHYQLDSLHYRIVAYSYVLAFYAFLFLFVGFLKSYRFFRLSGIILSILLVLKLYAYDIWQLNLLIKIIAWFGLGLGLVMLSIIYQKFGFKFITGNQKGKNILLLLCLPFLLVPGETFAETFREASFHYYKDFRVGETSDSKIKYGRFVLDKEVVSHSGLSDRRLVFNQKLIPFLTRDVIIEEAEEGKNPVKLIFTKATKEGFVYVLSFPKNPEGTQYHSISLSSEDKNYEFFLTVSLGEKVNEWQNANTHSFYQYGQQEAKEKKLDISPGNYSFARIETDSKTRLLFHDIYYIPQKKQYETKREISLKELRIKQKPVNRTFYYYDNPGNWPYNKLHLSFKERSFRRKITLYQQREHEKSFSYITSLTLYKKVEDDKAQIIKLPHNVSGILRLEIANGDDNPLELERFEVFSPGMEIIFPLENINSQGKLRLYYGNRYMQQPKFDFSSTFSGSKKLQDFLAEKEMKNEKFAYSIMEPPISSWIIRILYFICLLGISYPAYIAFQRYAEHRQEVEKLVTEKKTETV